MKLPRCAHFLPCNLSHLAEADILIAACGKAEYVTADWIKPGAAVIDVGINGVPDATKKSGYRLVRIVPFCCPNL
jgi:methylenetetrahydrofolate dehydrogenase (NADP+) / methenyltetrahydrofolate cyclohydrolase